MENGPDKVEKDQTADKGRNSHNTKQNKDSN